MRFRSGDKHHLRKSSDRKTQIRKAFIPLTGLICAFRSEDFLRWCLSPGCNLTHNLFFVIPIVFGIIENSSKRRRKTTGQEGQRGEHGCCAKAVPVAKRNAACAVGTALATDGMDGAWRNWQYRFLWQTRPVGNITKYFWCLQRAMGTRRFEHVFLRFFNIRDYWLTGFAARAKRDSVRESTISACSYINNQNDCR